MPSKANKAGVPEKMSAADKKKQKLANKAKANPAVAAANKTKSDAKRTRRAESGSVKKLG